MATPFPELDRLLDGLVGAQRDILGADLVGSYLVGSFAVGDADVHSDCDFLAVVRRRPTAEQEAALRAVHDEIPTRPVPWATDLEGSYAVAGELCTLGGLGREWLYIDRGWRVMQWSTHCNTLEHRWSLRERGVTLVGPPPATLVDEVPPDAIRARNRAALQSLLADLATWIDITRIAWGQRYAVTTACRHLYSIDTGAIASKKAALEWARDRVDPRWRELVGRALAERVRGYDAADVPDPDTVGATIAFVGAAARAQAVEPSPPTAG